jgi:hypothetical protein
MKIKVGKDYILPGETRKRDKSEIVWTTVWLVLIVGWSSFMIVTSIVTNFWSMPIKDIFMLLFLCNIPNFVFFCGFGFMLKQSNHVRTIEFLIHEYERWNWKESRYEKFYIKETIYLTENFIYHKYIGDSIEKMTPEELENYCKNMSGDYYYGYKTKDEVMISILNDIKKFIADDKANENIKIRNVKTLEVLSVDELKTKFENKEFDHLYEDKNETNKE